MYVQTCTLKHRRRQREATHPVGITVAVVEHRAEDVDHVIVGQVRDLDVHHLASVARLQDAVLLGALGVAVVLEAAVVAPGNTIQK